VWARHARTRATIPLDATPAPFDGNLLVIETEADGVPIVRHFDPLLDIEIARAAQETRLRRAHFVTCPNASTHRRKR
jgi:hypothetical protein